MSCILLAPGKVYDISVPDREWYYSAEGGSIKISTGIDSGSFRQVAASKRMNLVLLSLFALLLIGTFVHAYSYEALGFSIRVEHMAILALVALSPLVVLRSSRAEIRELWPFGFYLAYLAVSTISAFIHVRYLSFSLTEVFLQAVTFLGAIFSYLLVNDERKILRLAHAIIAIGVIEALLGIAATLYSTVAGTNFMAQSTPFSFKIPIGVQIEASRFGSLMLPVAMLSWVLFRTTIRGRAAYVYGTTSAIAFFAVLYSFSRADWIAAIVSMAFAEAALRLKYGLRINRRRLVHCLLATLIIFLVLMGFLSIPFKPCSNEQPACTGEFFSNNPVSNINHFKSKLYSTVDTSEDSISTYLRISGTAIDYWSDSPLLGAGPRAHLDPDLGLSPTPSFNLALLALHNSGVVGFVFFALFLLMAIIRSIQTVMYSRDPLAIAYVSGFFALLLVYNSTGNLISAYIWILLGVIFRMYYMRRHNPVGTELFTGES